MTAMDLGVIAWLTDLDVDITEVAPLVEQAGLESLFLTEHTHVPASRRDVLDDPIHGRDPRLLDHFTALGAAAAVTTRLRLGTAACVIAQRDPIITAKQVATVDHVSGGRFLFGVAAGWLEEEMRNHGVQPSQRWDLMREHLIAMKEIWTHDEAEFHGTHVDFDPIVTWPKPVQSPCPPILVGGFGPRSLHLAAEHGDQWLPIVTDLDEFDVYRAQLADLCDEAGRPPLGMTACLFDADERLISGCTERGVDRCVILAPTQDRASLETFLEQCAELRGRIG